MSRIQIPESDFLVNASEIWVGWDSPLETYFGQVYDHDEEVIFWVGINVHEIVSVVQLADIMGDHCNISDEIRAQLLRDYNERSEPTPLQVWGRSVGGE